MPIYEKSTAELMRQFVAERPNQEVFTADEIRAWFQQDYPRIDQKTIGCHLTKMSTNVSSRVNWRLAPDKDDLFYRIRPGEFRRYQRATDPKPIYDREENETNGEQGDEVEGAEVRSEANATFAEEDHLRDYLALNLYIVEPGLRLYEAQGRTGIEYQIRNRRIDLLAVGEDGALVVIVYNSGLLGIGM